MSSQPRTSTANRPSSLCRSVEVRAASLRIALRLAVVAKMKPLAAAAVELGAGVLPDGVEELPGKVLEVVIALGARDLLAGRAAHESRRRELDIGTLL